MEYGLIKDTTMQGIADGLRAKCIIPSTRDVDMSPERYKTKYVTSDTDPTPTKQPDTSGENFNINIPGATYLKFVFNIGKVVSNSETKPLGTIRFYKDGFENIDLVIYPTTADVLTYVLDKAYGSEVRVSISNSGNGSSHTFATIFDVYGVETITNEVLPADMVEAINNFVVPVAPPEEALTITGDNNYRFAEGHWDWFIKAYGDKIKTFDISSLLNTFQRSKLERIPFTLNIKNCTSTAPFYMMTKLVEVPKLRGTISPTKGDLSSAIESCYMLRDIEDLVEPEMLDYFIEYKCTSPYSGPRASRVAYCSSLRRLPSWWTKFRINPESTSFYAYSYCGNIYNFSNCYALDEARNLPVWACNTTAAQTGNMFSNSFYFANRLKSLTFELIDGQPVATRWKAQVIDLTYNVGYADSTTKIFNYNSGITTDKEVKDDATYQALKNDPDWFTLKIDYCRYNHDSAVETINSLPDTSAYLASAGGTNTIKFRGNAGSKTDGGAINTLTAEEIAVAAAKGWTVTLV